MSNEPGSGESSGCIDSNAALVVRDPPAGSSVPPSRPPVTADDLSRTGLFEGIAPEALARVLDECRVEHVDQEGLLIRPGEVADHLFVVLRGRLRIHLSGIDDEPVAFVEAGDIAGELSIIDNSPRSAYVVADQPCTLLEIKHDCFWRLAATHAGVPFNLLQIMASRVRGNNTSISESRRLQQLYKRHASVDALTGLYNRRWLDDMLPRQLKRSAMQAEPVSVVMIDVDHFKRFNDRHGHQAGDFILFAVAQLMKQSFRPTDLAARYGGEEFTVVLPNTDLRGAWVAADRVRTVVRQTEFVPPDGAAYPRVSVSMGIAELRSEEDAQALLQRADAALYQAKCDGRDCVRPQLEA